MTIAHPTEEQAWFEPPSLPGDSWRAQNLLHYAANPEPGPSIGGCVYAGKRHLLSGESESGKSWLALAWCIEELARGNPVVYIDHEMGRSMTLERLRVLGAPDRWIPSFRYADPTEPSVLAADQIEELVEDVTLVIIDATIGSLSLHLLDENSTTDIERWYQRVVDPLRASGAAVVVLDHVTKNPETRGKYAIGSQRKVGASDVHLSAECIRPFGRQSVGMAKVTVKKDRPGHLPRPTLGTFTLDPNGTPNTYTWDAYAGIQTAPDGHQRPTILMERVSEYVEQYGPTTKNQVEENVTGRAAYVRKATEALAIEGYISVQDVLGHGGNRSELTSIKPFRNLSEDPENATSSTSSAPRPGRTGRSSSSTSSAPFKGDESGRGTEDEPKPATSSPNSGRGTTTLNEPCPACTSNLAADPWSTAGGTYCCHDCARGEACNCKYLEEPA